MQRPAHNILNAAHGSPMSARRIAGIGLAGALNIAMIWAMTSGLAMKIVRNIPQDIQLTIVDTQEQSQPVLAPPKPAMVEPQDVPTVPAPEIDIQAPQAAAITATPAPSNAVSDASAAGITSTHSRPPYPPLARRLGQQGTVRLHLTISAQGDVTDAQVTSSSGVPELDQAAVSWVVAHWKYKPAIQGGVAVPSTTDAAVIFDLKKA